MDGKDGLLKMLELSRLDNGQLREKLVIANRALIEGWIYDCVCDAHGWATCECNAIEAKALQEMEKVGLSDDN